MTKSIKERQEVAGNDFVFLVILARGKPPKIVTKNYESYKELQNELQAGM